MCKEFKYSSTRRFRFKWQLKKVQQILLELQQSHKYSFEDLHKLLKRAVVNLYVPNPNKHSNEVRLIVSEIYMNNLHLHIYKASELLSVDEVEKKTF